MNPQTWRVVMASGEVREIIVTHDGEGTYDARWGGWFLSCEGSAEAAIARILLGDGGPVREVRGPGELTTAEQVAAAVAKERENRPAGFDVVLGTVYVVPT